MHVSNSFDKNKERLDDLQYMRDCSICDSKNGWLLLMFGGRYDLSDQTLQFVFYNPFKNKIIKLPPLRTIGGEVS